MPNYDAAVDNILLYPYYMFSILIFFASVCERGQGSKKTEI